MSYGFNHPCDAPAPCLKREKCTDRASIYGAICGIHQMPSGTGHLGAGTITLACCNKQEAQSEPETEPDH